MATVEVDTEILTRLLADSRDLNYFQVHEHFPFPDRVSQVKVFERSVLLRQIVKAEDAERYGR